MAEKYSELICGIKDCAVSDHNNYLNKRIKELEAENKLLEEIIAKRAEQGMMDMGFKQALKGK